MHNTLLILAWIALVFGPSVAAAFYIRHLVTTGKYLDFAGDGFERLTWWVIMPGCAAWSVLVAYLTGAVKTFWIGAVVAILSVGALIVSGFVLSLLYRWKYPESRG